MKIKIIHVLNFLHHFEIRKNTQTTSPIIFFENDTEQVEFLSNNIFIVDKQKPNYGENTLIQNPLIVLLDLSKVIYVLKNRYREFILDPSILEPLPIQQITGTCLNMTNLHAHITMDMDSKTNANSGTGEISTKKQKMIIHYDDDSEEEDDINTKISRQDDYNYTLSDIDYNISDYDSDTGNGTIIKMDSRITGDDNDTIIKMDRITKGSRYRGKSKQTKSCVIS